ncbi:hypothetical protein CEXT_709941, partial [Caerostris extrusa]
MDWNSLIFATPQNNIFIFSASMNRGLTIERLRKTNVCENERIATRFARVEVKINKSFNYPFLNQFKRSYNIF